jgi:putative aldouronate transport system permease protein
MLKTEMNVTCKLNKRTSYKQKIIKDFKINKYAYIMAIPVLLYYIIFHYGPMYGIIIAFKDIRPALGIWRSPWVGFQYFIDFLGSYYFWRLLKNTLIINLYLLIFGLKELYKLLRIFPILSQL